MLLKRRLDLHFSLKKGLAIILIGLLIGGFGVQMAAAPPTFTTTEQTNSTQYTTDFTHSATTISSNSSLYENGTTLTDKKVYYQHLHPTLNISPQTSTEPVNQEVSVRMFATQNREQNVIWEQNLPLKHNTVTYNSSANTLSLDIPEIQNSIAERTEELPQGSIVKYEVRYDTQYEYNNQEFSQTAVLTVNFDSTRTYSVTTTPSETTKTQQRTIKEPLPSQTFTINGDTYGTYGSLLAFVGLLFIILGGYLVYGSRFDERSYEDRLYQFHLEKYQDWITFGRPLTDPQLRDTENKVLVNTLKGLVQISIDSDARVVYSEELKRFYIFINENIYFFKPPSSTSPLELSGNIPPIPDVPSEEEQEIDEEEWKSFDF